MRALLQLKKKKKKKKGIRERERRSPIISLVWHLRISFVQHSLLSVNCYNNFGLAFSRAYIEEKSKGLEYLINFYEEEEEREEGCKLVQPLGTAKGTWL